MTTGLGSLTHLVIPAIGLISGGVTVAIRRLRENAGANWPVVEGRVHSVTVRTGEGRDHIKHAVLTYSYFLDQYESGEYVRSFLTEQRAWDFADAFKDKKVPVHYNPRNPSVSTLRREELERLLPPKLENTFLR